MAGVLVACGLCTGDDNFYEGRCLGAHMRHTHGVNGHGPARSPERIASALITSDPIEVQRVIDAVAAMEKVPSTVHPDDRLAALVVACVRGTPSPYRFGVNGQTVKHIKNLVSDGLLTDDFFAVAFA